MTPKTSRAEVSRRRVASSCLLPIVRIGDGDSDGGRDDVDGDFDEYRRIANRLCLYDICLGKRPSEGEGCAGVGRFVGGEEVGRAL